MIPPHLLDVSVAGAGDTVTCCWIAEGARAVGLDVRIIGGRNADLVRLFGQRLEAPVPPTEREGRTDITPVGGMSPIYRKQLDEGGGYGPITETWQESMPFKVRPQRPEHTISAEVADWAAREWQSHEERMRVLIFPLAAWGPRSWPAAYFLDVAWELFRQGWVVFAADRHKSRIERMPFWYEDQRWEKLAALAMYADLVICNESGPAHICGTLGVPTIVLCGPTRPECNLGYLGESVYPTRVSMSEVPCVGCHFKAERGFRFACDAQCRALMMFTPERLLKEINRWLSTRSSTGTPTPAAGTAWRISLPVLGRPFQPTGTGPGSALSPAARA